MRLPSETKRGTPARYTREQLLSVDSRLRDTLSRETLISGRSLFGQNLPVLDFPVTCARPEPGDLNFFEAHQLAKVTSKMLGRTDAEAYMLRKRLLDAHLLAQGSGTMLRQRVKEALAEQQGGKERGTAKRLII